jgi:hypothetical protein
LQAFKLSTQPKIFLPLVGGQWQAVAQLVEALRYKPKFAGSFPGRVTGIFH